MKNIEINYRFKFADGRTKDFCARLAEDTLRLQNRPAECPDWARMENFRCSVCTLPAESGEFCPAALNLIELVENFRDVISCDEVELLIETPQRKYFHRTSTQSALSSLMGIHLATSGCPVFEKIKPMVRFHLPFASIEETTYRMITMYLLAQYFLSRRGGRPDWELSGLAKLCANIFSVNQNVCAKMREVIEQDVIVNALVRLNASVDSLSFSMEEGVLREIEADFRAYLGQEAKE